jgi:hypothetical protein
LNLFILTDSNTNIIEKFNDQENLMKKLIVLTSFILMVIGQSFSQVKPQKSIEDGLYLITKIDTVATQLSSLSSTEIAVFFSQIFDDFNDDEYARIIIDTTDYVPLELGKSPVTQQETDSKKRLLLSLTKEASEKLKSFTAQHIMGLVALVVDGEALTKHKIREAITSGQLQISRCNDNACELLYVKLKDNVR